MLRLFRLFQCGCHGISVLAGITFFEDILKKAMTGTLRLTLGHNIYLLTYDQIIGTVKMLSMRKSSSHYQKMLDLRKKS